MRIITEIRNAKQLNAVHARHDMVSAELTPSPDLPTLSSYRDNSLQLALMRCPSWGRWPLQWSVVWGPASQPDLFELDNWYGSVKDIERNFPCCLLVFVVYVTQYSMSSNVTSSPPALAGSVSSKDRSQDNVDVAIAAKQSGAVSSPRLGGDGGHKALWEVRQIFGYLSLNEQTEVHSWFVEAGYQLV
jgi:hypothetical protein